MKAINLTSNFELPTLTNNTVNNLTNSLESLQTTYNRKRIFKRAYYITKTTGLTFGQALKQSWSESKAVILRNRIEAEAIKSKMLTYYTPDSHLNSIEYITKSMAEAEKMGINLNR